jgi:serine phosphatase RsbU (regulator of sigma subunit)
MKLNPALLRDPVPAALDQGHYLVLLAGARPARRVEIASQPVTVGRADGQTLVFADDELLSRRHAQFVLRDGSVVVEDLGSTNGTFVDGARLGKSRRLGEGAIVVMGAQTFKYERRSRDDVRRSDELDRDLEKASSYILSLLPAPIERGPVLANWRFVPSTQLGGDAFGYDWLDADTLAVYLIDVSGHGAGAAMHSVAVLNVLKQRALPHVDFANPGAVLSSLNNRFQMDAHDGMYFTMWYGVYRIATRTLEFSAAGHHPAYLVAANKASSVPLGVPDLMIGAVSDIVYEVQQIVVPPDSALYVFSDGVFEILTKGLQQLGLPDFLPHLLAPAVEGVPEPERLYQLMKARARGGIFDDDFSLLTLSFP